MYDIFMVQPKTPPVSLRLPHALRQQVEALASELGIARNATYVLLLTEALAAREKGKS